MQRVKVKILEGCLVAGHAVHPEEIIELDLTTAQDVLGSGRAVLFDESDVARHRGIPAIRWKQDDLESERSFKRVT